MASHQSTAQGRQKNSGYHPGLGGKIIVRDHYNHAGRPFVIPSGHGVLQPDLDDDLIQNSSGLIHRDLSAGPVYVPQRQYFLFNQASHFPLFPGLQQKAPVSPTVAPPVQADHVASTKEIAEDREIAGGNPCSDPSFIDRMKEGVLAEFNKRRALLGFPSLEQSIQDLKSRDPRQETFVDDILTVTRSVVGNPYRH